MSPERATLSEDVRGELLSRIVIPKALSTITPDNKSGIPPFDVSKLAAIRVEDQAEISQMVGYQWSDLLQAASSQLKRIRGKKTRFGNKVYGLKPSYWKEYEQKYKEHLPSHASPEAVFSQSNVPQSESTIFEGYAYYRGLLMGEMIVGKGRKGVVILYYNHLFYGDGCVLEINKPVEGGGIYERKEIVYPNIPTPGHLDFGPESREKQTHYEGEVHKPLRIKNADLYKNMPKVFVSFHKREYVGDLGVKETVEHVDYPRTRVIEISKWQEPPYTDWYVHVNTDFLVCTKFYTTSETNGQLTRVSERYESNKRLHPRGDFYVPPEYFTRLDETSPLYKDRSVFTLDKTKPYITLDTYSTGKFTYTPTKLVYSGVKTKGKELTIEFEPSDDRGIKIKPVRVLLGDENITTHMKYGEADTSIMRFDHPDFTETMFVHCLKEWEVFI